MLFSHCAAAVWSGFLLTDLPAVILSFTVHSESQGLDGDPALPLVSHLVKSGLPESQRLQFKEKRSD